MKSKTDSIINKLERYENRVKGMQKLRAIMDEMESKHRAENIKDFGLHNGDVLNIPTLTKFVAKLMDVK